MEAFDKLRGIKPIERTAIFTEYLDIDRSNWLHVFSACLGKVIAIRNACNKLVMKNRKGNIDFSKGVISFGTDEFPLQFIGNESTVNNTWLWSWENKNGFFDGIIDLANNAKTIGQKWELEQLTTEKFGLNGALDGRALSIVACGLADDKYCYYKESCPDGMIFVAFSGVPTEVFAPLDDSTFVNLIMQCVFQFQVDYRVFLESLLFWNGTKYTRADNKIIAHFEEDLCIEFDQIKGFVYTS